MPPAVPPGFVVETLTETLSRARRPRAPARRPRADHRARTRRDQGVGRRPERAGRRRRPRSQLRRVRARPARDRRRSRSGPAGPTSTSGTTRRGPRTCASRCSRSPGDLTNPASTNLALGAQYDILTDVPDLAAIHNGGSLRFGPDGMLYLSIGDDGEPVRGPGRQQRRSGASCGWTSRRLPGPGSGPPAKASLIPAGNPFSGSHRQRAARLVLRASQPVPVPHRRRDRTPAHRRRRRRARRRDRRVRGGRPELRLALARGEPERAPVHGHRRPRRCTRSRCCTTTACRRPVMSFGRYRNALAGPHNFGAALRRRLLLLRVLLGPDAAPAVQRHRVDPGASRRGPARAERLGHRVPVGRRHRARPRRRPLLRQAVQRAPSRARSAASAAIRTRSSSASCRATTSPATPGARCSTRSSSALTTRVRRRRSPALPVTFAVAAGGGSVNPPVASTDAQGLASTVYTLAVELHAAAGRRGDRSAGPRTSRSTSSGAGSASCTCRRRSARSPPRFATARPTSPFTLVWEPPAPAPYLPDAVGHVWTSVLAPLAGRPGARRPRPPRTAAAPGEDGSASPFWGSRVTGLPPLGGVTLLFQAYAIDTSLFPAPESIMISNPQIVTIL